MIMPWIAQGSFSSQQSSHNAALIHTQSLSPSLCFPLLALSVFIVKFLFFSLLNFNDNISHIKVLRCIVTSPFSTIWHSQSHHQNSQICRTQVCKSPLSKGDIWKIKMLLVRTTPTSNSTWTKIIDNERPRSKKPMRLSGMRRSTCKWLEFTVCHVFVVCWHSNLSKGEDQLHVKVYDEDLIEKESIGSTNVSLKKIEQAGGRLDEWFTLPAHLGLGSNGEVHLILQLS